ncbi:MAG TPA: DUF4926 domain-containing protein [Phycisphaerae bacterium]|nr:DUF4926 domain-containing protein [Phycisphaerae bacterium]
MTFELFTRVVLTREIPEEGLRTGDVGTIVEEHRDPAGNVVGFEVELFCANGDTLAVASVPADAIRKPCSSDRLTTRAG